MDKLQQAYNYLSIEDMLDTEISLADVYQRLYGVFDYDFVPKDKPLPIEAYEILWDMFKAITVEKAVKMKFITEEQVLKVFADNDPTSDWDTDQAIIDEEREWRDTPEPRPILE